jgi:transcriptional regulator GlxA family with amidase domain
MNIRILAFDGADELDFIGPLEIFRRAAKLVKDLDVALVTVEPQAEIVTAHGLRIRPDGLLSGHVDLLIVPGGGYAARAPQGVGAEIERGVIPRRIGELHLEGTSVAGVCTGTMAIAAADLLGGRPATTHHSTLNDLQAAGAQLAEARVVDDGDIITCGGVTSSLDLALWLVKRYWGDEMADGIARQMEYTRNQDVYVSPRAKTRNPAC